MITRVAAALQVIRNGVLYWDVDGNLLPTSSGQVHTCECRVAGETMMLYKVTKPSGQHLREAFDHDAHLRAKATACLEREALDIAHTEITQEMPDLKPGSNRLAIQVYKRALHKVAELACRYQWELDNVVPTFPARPIWFHGCKLATQPCCEAIRRLETTPGDATTLIGWDCPVHGVTLIGRPPEECDAPTVVEKKD